MLFAETWVPCKDGRQALLRSPRESDAAELLQLLRRCTGETEFLLRSPEECDISLQQEIAFVRRLNESGDSLMLVCLVEGEMVGNCQINFYQQRKMRHRASVGIMLQRKHWGLGLGTAMLRQLLDVAKDRGLMQVELEVIEGNERAIGLYKKLGFEMVAAKPDAICLKDGGLRKEYFMVKRL